MSVEVKLSLDTPWSIDSIGYLMLDITPKGVHGKVLGSFTFDEDTILDALEDDLEIKASDPSYDLTDWYNLKHRLEEIAEAINDKLEEALS